MFSVFVNFISGFVSFGFRVSLCGHWKKATIAPNYEDLTVRLYIQVLFNVFKTETQWESYDEICKLSNPTAAQKTSKINCDLCIDSKLGLNNGCHCALLLKKHKIEITEVQHFNGNVNVQKLTRSSRSPDWILTLKSFEVNWSLTVNMWSDSMSLVFGSLLRTRCVIFPNANDWSARMRSRSGISVSFLIS